MLLRRRATADRQPIESTRLCLPPHFTLQRRRYVLSVMFCPSRLLSSVPCHRYFFRFTGLLIDIGKSLPPADYMITFWAKVEQRQGGGYDRKFESTSISVAAISNRC